MKVIKGILVFLVLISCKSKVENEIIYKTESLLIEQLSPNVFMHQSYIQTDDFGKVSCNGMIYIINNESYVFDTPTTDIVSKELISWIKKSKKSIVKGVIIGHFHDDCLGGLKEFHDQNITSFANNRTIDLAQKEGLVIPKESYDQRLDLNLGEKKINIQFLGEGHTKDNSVSYLENENILFGGCMIKSLNASKGYLGDSNIKEWSNTVLKVKNTFPNVKKVIPGHGKVGDVSLLNYTIQLFKE